MLFGINIPIVEIILIAQLLTVIWLWRIISQ